MQEQSQEKPSSNQKQVQNTTQTQLPAPTQKVRHFNHSANIVKSPIATASSMKSQNSQQAGPNNDEIAVKYLDSDFTIDIPNEALQSIKVVPKLIN